jgi:hypothetical protein
VIKVTIKIIKGGYKVRVLVNLGIEANYIKKKLALEMGILLILEVILLVILNKS